MLSPVYDDCSRSSNCNFVSILVADCDSGSDVSDSGSGLAQKGSVVGSVVEKIDIELNVDCESDNVGPLSKLGSRRGISKAREKVKVCYFNARSIVNKIKELKLFITEEKCDILGITEAMVD